jgi:hypothetical protein
MLFWSNQGLLSMHMLAKLAPFQNIMSLSEHASTAGNERATIASHKSSSGITLVHITAEIDRSKIYTQYQPFTVPNKTFDVCEELCLCCVI